MAIIPHSELFDFDAFDKGIKQSGALVKDLGKTVDEVLSRLNSQQKEITATLRQYEILLKTFNVSQVGATDALKQFNKEVDETIRRKKANEDSERGLKTAMDVTRATVTELKEEYKRLQKQYEALKPDQADYAKQVENINKRLREVVPGINDFNTAVKKTKAEITNVEGSYYKMNQTLGELRTKLRSMPDAFDPVTGALNKNNKEAVALVARIQELDKTLKAADAAMGNYQRNVGNYASGFNGLRTSINQLSREAPAFANSMQTGFLAISNNLPMLIDEINNLKKANVDLVASGEKPISIFKQLGAAFFSWQTLISAGITLLTVYGAEIVDWVVSLVSAEKAVDGLAEKQALLNDVNKTANKDAGSQISQLKILYSAATDVNSSMTDRLKAVDALQAKFPEYFKNIKDETILNGNAKKQYDELYDSIIKSARARAASAKLDELESQRLDIEAQKRKINTAVYNERVTAKDVTYDQGMGQSVTYTRAQQIAAANKRGADALAEQNKLLEQIAAKEKVLVDLVGKKELAETATDEKAEAKAVKDAEKLAEKQAKARLDAVRKAQELIQKAAELDIKNSELSYTKKEISEEQHQRNKLAIIEKSVNKQIELEKSLGGQSDGDKIEGYREKEIAAELEFTKFVEKQAGERHKINQQLARSVQKTYEEQKQEEQRIEEENSNKIEEIRKRSLKRETDAENRRYELLKAGNNLSFMEEMQHLERLKNIRKKNGEETADIELEIEKRTAERKKEIREQAEGFLFDAGRTGLSILQEQGKAESEARLMRLQDEKARELQLAGNNLAAREKIEADYQKKVNAEKAKQAKADKAYALFNVAINTAQAVAKTIATWGWPIAIPFAAMAIAQGALQAALIASRPIPKFAKGKQKDSYIGPAIVNEEGFELIERNGRMYVANGHGPTLVNLKGGERIHTHAESKRIIERSFDAAEANNIARSFRQAGRMGDAMQAGRQAETVAALTRALQSGGMNQATLTAAFSSAIKEIPVTEMHWNERGYSEAQRRRGDRTTYLNNRYS